MRKLIFLALFLPSFAHAGYFCLDQSVYPHVQHPEHATAAACIGAGYSWKFTPDGANRLPESVLDDALTRDTELSAGLAGKEDALTCTDDQIKKWSGGEWVCAADGGSSGGAVDSVNGQTGVVVLDADDIAETAMREFVTPAQKALIYTAVQPADLATVATTGSYNDLSNKPTITDDQNAAEVPFTPAGGIAATDTQAAIEEVKAYATGLALLQSWMAAGYMPTISFNATGPICQDTGTARADLAASLGVSEAALATMVKCDTFAGTTISVAGYQGGVDYGVITLAGEAVLALAGKDVNSTLGVVSLTAGQTIEIAGLASASTLGGITLTNTRALVAGIDGTVTLGAISVAESGAVEISVAAISAASTLGAVTATASASGNSFSETFDSGLGQFAGVSGTPENSSGRLFLNAAGEAVRVATSTSRGFYVEFDAQFPLAPNLTQKPGIILTFGTTDQISANNRYATFIFNGDDGEQTYLESYSEKNGVGLSYTPLFPAPSASDRRFRVEYLVNGNIVVKVGSTGTTPTTVVSTATDGTPFNSFSYLFFTGIETADQYVDNVTVGSL